MQLAALYSTELIPNQSLFDWLEVEHSLPRYYFRSRDRDYELAAVGTKDYQFFEHHESLCQALETAPQLDVPLCFLSCFESKALHYTELPERAIFRPEIAIVRKGDNYKLVYTEEASEILPNLINKARSGLNKQSKILTKVSLELKNRSDYPGDNEWLRIARELVQRLEQCETDKVVLARKTRLELSERLDLLRALNFASKLSRSHYCFWFAPSPEGPQFLSLSPEKLFSIENQSVLTEALGGTLEAELASTNDVGEKLLREHNYVVDFLRTKLENLCASIRLSEGPKFREAGTVFHLLSELAGKLNDSKTMAQVLCSLHRTPAVLGSPAESAEQFIGANESFRRGLYAGSFGVVDAGVVDCMVLIRSLISTGSALEFFAGAGFVRGSEPSAEWREINQKMQSLSNFLELNLSFDD